VVRLSWQQSAAKKLPSEMTSMTPLLEVADITLIPFEAGALARMTLLNLRDHALVGDVSDELCHAGNS